jgi:hypothetical protein
MGTIVTDVLSFLGGDECPAGKSRCVATTDPASCGHFWACVQAAIDAKKHHNEPPLQRDPTHHAVAKH